MKEFYERHQNVALMFSGGKDSIACLDLVKDYLDRTLVVWNNTGANFPEIVEYINEVKNRVPNFLEIRTNQPESIRLNGYPVDVLPINFSSLGQACTTDKPLKLRSYFDCCAENFWIPCNTKMKELNVTGIIRGQRLSESHKSPVKSGDVLDGIEYYFPIQNWSDEDVIKYLEASNVVIDERLKMSHSSLDCWNCTAYLNDSQERMQYIKNRHPEKFQEIVKVVKQIDNAIKAEAVGINQILEL